MPNSVKISFFDTKPYDKLTFDFANKKYGFEISYLESRLKPVSAKLAQGSSVVCAFVNDEIGAETVEALSAAGVKLIAMRCAGFNNVDLKSACKKMRVIRVPEYSPSAVAEYALGLVLCLNRSINRAYCRVREGNFSINGFMGFDLKGKTFGIVGMGKIGRAFAKVLSGLDVKILAYDVFKDKALEKSLNFTYASLAEIYAQSDVISLHCPLTKENEYMINSESISQMKRNVIIVNTSRGKLIDTRALVHGLKKGLIAGAALDVYEEEAKYFYEDCSNRAISDDILARLLTFPNVLVTSHQAFFTREAMQNIADITLSGIKDFVEGRALKNDVCTQLNCKKS